MFELITLPYAPDALAPVISAETIAYHHGKHLQTYVNNLNVAIAGTPFDGKSLEEIVCTSEGGIFNNAGQILNHNMYFLQFHGPRENNKPTGRIAEMINGQFGDFETFKQEFTAKGASLFGSGWVWLALDKKEDKLVITQEGNAGNPVTKGLKPVLTFDVWEHAYYIDYRNARPAYMNAMWQIINWDEVNERIR
ncbi:MAG: superoxide dismutase [Bacteroidales bacterium]|nr:superoxide dismutase [Bacteroidales bacterium]